MAEKPRLDLFRSYVAAIENSVGTNLFRKMYFHIDGESIDVLDDGDLSCAVYVSAVLYLFGLIRELHTTVKETVRDIQEKGWYEIKEPRKGALILWDFAIKNTGTPGTNRHIGFYIDEHSAVSNSAKTKRVELHPPGRPVTVDSDIDRKILAYYWHDKLNA